MKLGNSGRYSNVGTSTLSLVIHKMKTKSNVSPRILPTVTCLGAFLFSLSLTPSYAGNLVTLDSEYLGGGTFEYRLSCVRESLGPRWA